MLIRPRTADDLPRLEQILIDSQPHTGYPSTWPLTRMTEREFIARGGEVGAWVVMVDDRVVGHAAVTHPDPADELTSAWVTDTGRPPTELGLIGAVFVDHRLIGQGVGGALLDHAVAWVRAQGWTPILDVLDEQARAKALYERRGWRSIAVTRPAWAPRNTPVTLMVLDQPADHPAPVPR